MKQKKKIFIAVSESSRTVSESESQRKSCGEGERSWDTRADEAVEIFAFGKRPSEKEKKSLSSSLSQLFHPAFLSLLAICNTIRRGKQEAIQLKPRKLFFVGAQPERVDDSLLQPFGLHCSLSFECLFACLFACICVGPRMAVAPLPLPSQCPTRPVTS